jgi:hypothetical protein
MINENAVANSVTTHLEILMPEKIEEEQYYKGVSWYLYTCFADII